MTVPTSTESVKTPARRGLPSPQPLSRLWPRVRPHLGPLVLASAALLGSAGISLAFPRIVGSLLDAAFVTRGRELLDRIALLLLGLFAIQAVLNYVQAYLLSATGERAVAGLRQELFDKLLSMPPGFFADRRTGELTSRLSTDVGLLQGILSHQIAEFSRQVLALIGGVVMLLIGQPQLTLTALAVVPVAVGTALFFGRRLRKVSTGVQDKLAESTAVAEEAFSQIRTVQSFVQERHESGRYRERILGVVKAAVNRAQIRGVFFGAITFAGFGAMVVVLWQGGLLVLEGKLTAGSLFSFLLYTFTIAGAVGALASFFSAYQESVGAAERVFELLETAPPIADPVMPVELHRPVQGSVSMEGVWFSYAGQLGSGAAGQEEAGQRGRGAAGLDGAGVPGGGDAGQEEVAVGDRIEALPRSPTYPLPNDSPRSPAGPLPSPPLPRLPDWALQDLTLRLAPGEIVALVGPSGAGKTTVASLLPRFWDVSRGRILLDGIDIRTLRLADLRRAIGVVPQEPALFSGTVHENIAYARPDASHADIEAASRAAHAHEFVARLPLGYETLVGERGVKLSGGQRQRIAIARAILKDPALLILDEATSSLDTESERLIEDAMEKLLVGRTTLIIAHRLSTVRRADRLVVLDRGRIVEIGTHAALLAEGGLYARLYQQQFREEEEPLVQRTT